MIVEFKNKDEFREAFRLKERRLRGKMVRFTDKIHSNEFILVGANDYTEFNSIDNAYDPVLVSLMGLLKTVESLETRNNTLELSNKVMSRENVELKDRIKSRYDMSSKELSDSAKFSATRFAAIIMACRGKKEILETIDTAAREMVGMVQSFKKGKHIGRKYVVSENE